jgi:hypothetical protein
VPRKLDVHDLMASTVGAGEGVVSHFVILS